MIYARICESRRGRVGGSGKTTRYYLTSHFLEFQYARIGGVGWVDREKQHDIT